MEFLFRLPARVQQIEVRRGNTFPSPFEQCLSTGMVIRIFLSMNMGEREKRIEELLYLVSLFGFASMSHFVVRRLTVILRLLLVGLMVTLICVLPMLEDSVLLLRLRVESDNSKCKHVYRSMRSLDQRRIYTSGCRR